MDMSEADRLRPASASRSSSFFSSCSSFAQRYSAKISNPAARIAQGVSPEKRRDAFLRRLREDREEKKLETRGDQMLGMDRIEWRRREEAMARSAPDFGLIDEELAPDGGDELMQEGPCRGTNPQVLGGMLSPNVFTFLFPPFAMSWLRKFETGDMDALEQFISEEKEFQTLVDELAREQDGDRRAQRTEESSYGDDEDYESLFVDLLSYGDPSQSEPNQRMDTSHG
jgi:hypothetical protein